MLFYFLGGLSRSFIYLLVVVVAAVVVIVIVVDLVVVFCLVVVVSLGLVLVPSSPQNSMFPLKRAFVLYSFFVRGGVISF